PGQKPEPRVNSQKLQKLRRSCAWWPQRDSNPCFSLERAVSWASRRWGRANNAPAPSEWMAGGGGFEPPLRGPEPRVLPLDDPAHHGLDGALRRDLRAPRALRHDHHEVRLGHPSF